MVLGRNITYSSSSSMSTMTIIITGNLRISSTRGSTSMNRIPPMIVMISNTTNVTSILINKSWVIPLDSSIGISYNKSFALSNRPNLRCFNVSDVPFYSFSLSFFNGYIFGSKNFLRVLLIVHERIYSLQ